MVYAGSRAVALEDVAAPRARTMDADYRAMGDEFGRVQHPLLRDSIVDPLAMNGAMNGDGRVAILYTRFVNDPAANTAGYMNACNFYPKSTFAASNENEVFYARVVTVTETPADCGAGGVDGEHLLGGSLFIHHERMCLCAKLVFQHGGAISKEHHAGLE